MKTILKNKRVKNIIIITVVSCLSFGLGFLTAYKVDVVNEQPILTSKDDASLKTAEKTATTSITNKPDANEDDPLTHLKLLQKDVETFKALMEEVKNALFVTDNA
tara:strand:+ start:295 stop:609 length:315 start_codon:yes stop_codon:yes gene_type:complete